MAPLLGGCGVDEDQFTIDVCSKGLDMLSSVELADAVDYVELREVADLGELAITVVDAVGTLCGGAADPEACALAMMSLPTDSTLARGGGFEVSTAQSLAYTRGDEVGSINDMPALKTFLGDIDAPGDAALLGRLSGYDLRCDEPRQVGEHPEGYVLYTSTGSGCGVGDDVRHQVVLVRTDGSFQVLQNKLIDRGDPGCAIGRLPPGLCSRGRADAADPVGRFFAEVAHLEAASAPAFEQLARELVVHGAPGPLVRAALRAREDERRHARVTARLARRHGGRPTPPRVRPTPLRSLIEVLADNAAEGCVREAFGARVAAVQARRAGDPVVRRALAGIAVDEARHARLSRALDRWARARMSVAERRRVARAAAEAVERLEVELVQPLDPRVHALAGMPGPVEACAMYGRLRAELRADGVV